VELTQRLRREAAQLERLWRDMRARGGDSRTSNRAAFEAALLTLTRDLGELARRQSRANWALGESLAALREQLPDTLQDQVEFLEDYQLQIEHALDLIGRKKVLFMDASLNCAAPFEVTELQPTQDASFTTHALSPQALLQVYQDMQGEPPPPCTLLAIRGEAFELGEPPSKAALANLEHARAWASQWLLKVS